MTGWVASLVTLAFVMSVTPGPNNVLFAASGSRSGYVGSLPVLAGMVGGFAAVIAACMAGVGALVGSSPRAHVALTVLAAAYMAWIAVHLWREAAGDGPEPGGPSRTVTWSTMAALQAVNPKTWLAAATFVSGSLGPNSPGGRTQDLAGAVVFLGVVALSASLWTLFGSAARTGLRPGWLQRWNRLLAALSGGTALAFLWGLA